MVLLGSQIYKRGTVSVQVLCQATLFNHWPSCDNLSVIILLSQTEIYYLSHSIIFKLRVWRMTFISSTFNVCVKLYHLFFVFFLFLQGQLQLLFHQYFDPVSNGPYL